MKIYSKIFMSSLVFIALLTHTSAFAEEKSYVSNGLVEFVASDDPTNPVDPTDPSKPIDPIDPTDPNGPNPGTNGPLSIDYASSLNFGQQKITSKDSVYFAAAQSYKGLNESGQPVGKEKTGPNFVQVTDNRGIETGWKLSVKQEGQFTSENKKVLTGAQITFKNGNVVTNSESGKPTGNATTTLDAEGSESEVLIAITGNGAGTYLYTWGDQSSADTSIELSVPGSTTKYAEKYTTKLTWMLKDTPENE